MKTILQLHKPILPSPKFRIVVSGSDLPMLRKLIGEGVDPSKKQIADKLIDDINTDFDEIKKHNAIAELANIVVKEGYFDERIVPTVVGQIKDPKFAKHALAALSSLVGLVSAYDRNLLEVFDNNLIEDRVSSAARGIRTLVGRENYRPGLVRKLSILLSQPRDLESSVEILGALNALLTVDCGVSQEDLGYIADLSQPKVFSRDQMVITSGKSLTHEEYIKSEALIQMPELEPLITITSNQIVINYTKLKSDAIAQIGEKIRLEREFSQSTVLMLGRSISTGTELIRTNSVAAISAVANIPTGLNGQSYSLVRGALEDQSVEVRENSFEGLLDIVSNSEVVGKEAESIFITNAVNGESEKIRICSFLGLAKILSSRKIENSSLGNTLIRSVGNDTASPLEKRAALIAAGSYLSWFDIPSNDFISSLLRRTVDRDEDVRGAAFEALAQKLTWGDIKEIDSLIIAGINDHFPSVRAKAFKCAVRLIDFRCEIPDDLIKRVELSLYNQDSGEVAGALFLLGNIVSKIEDTSRLTLDIPSLINFGSKGDFQVSRAATFCLASIVNSKSLPLEAFEEDKIEILCRIHEFLPYIEGEESSEISKAYGYLNEKYKIWKGTQLTGIHSDPITSRILYRSEAAEAGLEFIGNALVQVQEQLLSAQKRIRDLSNQNLDLSIKLEKEREIRAQLEEYFDLQCLQLIQSNDREALNEGNIVSAKMTLWLLERLVKVGLGCDAISLSSTLTGIVTDAQIKVIRRLPRQVAGLALSNPLQSTFGIDTKSVHKAIDVLDYRAFRHWAYDKFGNK